ncbi:MAG: peptidase [Cocleimonas sp.]|nr:peptidase [Cocleimonas sp.]
MKKLLLSTTISVLLLTSSASFAKPVSSNDILNNYANIAYAIFDDSLITANKLNKTVDALIANPSEASLDAAKLAWKAARVPYQQSEAYRFGNAIVDEWEGKVNAWPLDEGLIDYVSNSAYGTESDENPLYTANIIASKKLKIMGKMVDATTINKALLERLHEAGEVEANVATGYHAIEFLLWGQDLHGTKAGAGERKATDYGTKNCTNGNCDRRAAYLKAATELLIDDLAWMKKQWETKGKARTDLLAKNEKDALSTIITGMGSLSYGELAGERMKLGLMLHDPEEEHDCFSDNTYNSHFYDAKGIQNVYLGQYKRINGTKIKGASLSQLIAAKDASVDNLLQKKIAITVNNMLVLVKTGKSGEAYDQMIAEGNKVGNKKVQDSIDSLVAQARAFEKALPILELSNIKFEGSDSLDSPEKVGAGG